MTHDLRLLLRVAALPPALILLPHAGAQPAPPTVAATACTPGVCTITVTVTGHCRNPGGIAVAPSMASTRQPTLLRWTLTPGSYEFHDDGIGFDDIAQFEPLPSPNNLREIRYDDNRAKAGDFHYRVRLRGCPEAEGWIRHD